MSARPRQSRESQSPRLPRQIARAWSGLAGPTIESRAVTLEGLAAAIKPEAVKRSAASVLHGTAPSRVRGADGYGVDPIWRVCCFIGINFLREE